MLMQNAKYVMYVGFMPVAGRQTIPQPKEGVIILYNSLHISYIKPIQTGYASL